MPRKLNVVLPKSTEDGQPYLSYSQYSKFKRSPKEYYRQYFFGEPFDGNAYTDFGSLIGEALETGDFSAFSEEEQKVLKKVTRLDQFEREITWDLNGFVVTGYIDTNDRKVVTDSVEGDKEVVTTIIDYKTGALNKVAEYEDENYDQVTIYAGAILQQTGAAPKKGWVELIERTGNAFKGEELKLGFKTVKIPQNVTKKKIKETETKLRAAAKEISDRYKVFKKLEKFTV